MTTEELWKALQRHVGHQLQCVRESTVAGGHTVDTVSIRCEACGEVVVESVKVKRTKAHGTGALR